ncbi:polynucleotide adenylyltransferase [Haliangium ochraceum]|uniref:Polynucleotide adenylyltransferase region n=1 Tax=Haliangium ochraceum (strain DSM 14365 / JCM 11303 / SMP-2) TaxID=502025 RepID=D0LQI0_HALO1|nr:polynucleotide adenylyltransferase [Haliangium ochraceum]ACY18989.1 Polynucleotide adenylyltransferase region [Haliangium ochraceum DSM 14365]
MPIDTNYPVHAVDERLIEADLSAPVYRHADAAADARAGRDISAREVLDALSAAGMAVFVVGGAPRDWLCGETARDFDVAVNQPIERVQAALRERFPDIEGVLFEYPHFGMMRWGTTGSGIDINILRTAADLHPEGVASSQFSPGSDLAADARMRDFSINAFYYPCRGPVVFDPLGCGLDELRSRTLRMVTEPALLACEPRTTPRIVQFVCRGYAPARDVLDYLDEYAERDVLAMGERLARWMLHHLDDAREARLRFRAQLACWLRNPVARACLERAMATAEQPDESA